MYFPKYRGSRGGHGLTSQGGRGGGYIHLTISSHLLVDGTIDVDGSHAEPAASKVDAGGGSGGAVYIRYFNNSVARTLKKLHTSKGDYWIKQ